MGAEVLSVGSGRFQGWVWEVPGVGMGVDTMLMALIPAVCLADAD